MTVAVGVNVAIGMNPLPRRRGLKRIHWLSFAEDGRENDPYAPTQGIETLDRS